MCHNRQRTAQPSSVAHSALTSELKLECSTTNKELHNFTRCTPADTRRHHRVCMHQELLDRLLHVTTEPSMGPLIIHICAVQFVHKRGTHITRLAQGPARLKKSRIAFHLCAPEKNLSSDVAHVSPFCCSLTCRLPRALHHAIKNHSGAKTCRVTETRAPQLPNKIADFKSKFQFLVF